jgi:PAS domain S-box-containing protein
VDKGFFLDLAHNAALLLAMALIFDVMIVLRWKLGRSYVRQVAVGGLLGAMGIAVMLTPWEFLPGLVFDTRSALLGISGLFFGPVPTLVAVAMTGVFRVSQGGLGALTGVSVILASGAIGVAWRHARKGPLADITWRELFLFGVIVHVAMLLLMFTLPVGTAAATLQRITAPVLIIFPLATALLGGLMANRLWRERARATLLESEQYSKALFSGSRFPLAVMDPDTTRLIDFNGAMAELLGLENWSQAFETTLADLCPASQPHGHASVWALRSHVDAALDAGEGEFTWRLRRPNGETWDAAVRLMRFQYGDRNMLQVSLEDITARVRAERRLAESEERLRLGLTAANQGLFDLDLRTGDATVSPECAMMLGHDPAGYDGSNEAFFALLHPDDRERMRAYGAAYLAGEIPEYKAEFRMRTASGGWKWVLSLARIVERDGEGNPVRLIGTQTDIDKLKRTEERLVAAKAEMAHLLETSEKSRIALLSVVEDQKLAQDALWIEKERVQEYLNIAEVFFLVIDLSGNVVLVTRKGCELVGRPEEEIIGKNWFDEFLPDRIRAGVSIAFQSIVAGNVEMHAYHENPVSCLNGEEKLVAWHNTVVRDDSGAIVGTLSSGEDITERRLAEARLAEQLEELRRWHDAMIGRETRVLELKCEVNELLVREGKPPRYISADRDRPTEVPRE